MRFSKITRINPTSGGIDRPWRSRDHHFELAPVDPSTGASDLRLPRRVDNYGEALELVRQGWAIRMGNGQSSTALVAPHGLRLTDEPYEFIDELWTYSMPTAPFARDALLADLREFLIQHAAAIRLIAGRSAALAFIDTGAAGPERFDLSSFRLTGLVMAAYDSAFRTGADRPLHGDDIACVQHLLDIILRPRRHRAWASGAGEYPALRHTIRCAWLRWKISQGTLDDCELDLPLAECLGAMAGLSYQAARNALAREKVRLVKCAPCCEEIAAWLERRRDFHPLRECENPRMAATLAALAVLAAGPPDDALAKIREYRPNPGSRSATSADAAPGMANFQTACADRVPPASLRDFARAQGLCIDTFVARFPRKGDASGGRISGRPAMPTSTRPAMVQEPG